MTGGTGCFLSLLAILVCSFPVQGTISQTARRCGANQEARPNRVFANSDGHGWHEYKDVKSVPELDLNGGTAALLWPGEQGRLLVLLQEPGEDFTGYTDYCFDKAGRLIQLRYELRTAWGWGYREEGSFEHGQLKRNISEFFSTETEQHIDRPEQASDVPEALNPTLYATKSRLPFANLLKKAKGSA